MDEKEKLQLRKKEDLRFMQGCVIVLFALVAEFYLFQVRDYYYGMMGTLNHAFRLEDMWHAGVWLGLALAVAGLVWTVISFVTGKGDIFYPIAVFSLGYCIFAMCYGIDVYGQKGLNILLFLVPAWAGLGLVFCLYQVEFFISAFFTSLGGVGLWLCGQTTLYEGGGLDKKQLIFYVFLNASILIIIAGFYLVNKAFHQEGTLLLGKQELTLLSDLKDNSSLWLVGLSGVISLLALAIAVTFGFQVIFYCTVALLVWLFVLLVYYTVKMM